MPVSNIYFFFLIEEARGAAFLYYNSSSHFPFSKMFRLDLVISSMISASFFLYYLLLSKFTGR